MLSERLDELIKQPTEMLSIKGVKPLKALQMLRARLGTDPEAREKWLGEARVASILGSCPRSKDSFRSGVRHWLEFVEIAHGPELCGHYAFPPTMTDVLAWANLFRCSGARDCTCSLSTHVIFCLLPGTFANYLTHLRGACIAMGYAEPPKQDPGITRAMVSIVKREFFEAKKKKFISRQGPPLQLVGASISRHSHCFAG